VFIIYLFDPLRLSSVTCWEIIFFANFLEMDVLTMVLIERETGLPLDVVVLINNFLCEKLTDENFKEAIALWFDNEEAAKFRFGHISYWNTSRVTDMKKAFYERINFNEDISRWNVSNVTNMCWMFSGGLLRGAKFNGDLSLWDVSKVENMSFMFHETSQFNGDLSRWDVSKVTNMSWMFSQAIAFNGNISRWDVRNVTRMECMFSYAMDFDGMLSSWDISNVRSMKFMFKGAISYHGVRWEGCS
jgi:trimeric autotransporter adhesin